MILNVDGTSGSSDPAGDAFAEGHANVLEVLTFEQNFRPKYPFVFIDEKERRVAGLQEAGKLLDNLYENRVEIEGGADCPKNPMHRG